MHRFVVTAGKPEDILALLLNTKAVYKDVEWDAGSIVRLNGGVDVSENELNQLCEAGDFKGVDAHIMSGEVPVGGMIVVADKDNPPTKGFVCGNGINWHVVDLPDDVVEATMKKVQKGRK